jgi:mannose-6-phosphate isomerase-like protein (cupin superfamily)
MTMTTTPIDLFGSALHLHPDGDVRAAWQVAAFRAATDADVHADHWEMHPHAEEVVCCLTGGVRLYLRPTTAPGAAEEMVRLTPGTATVVPRGRWHRLELDAPSELMSITPREGTRHERRTDAPR